MSRTPKLEDRIADGIASLKTASLPAPVIAAAEQLVTDWLGCVLFGAEAAPALAIARAHADEIGHGAATCFVGPALCHPSLAALISGTAAHTIELDDIYSPALYHPSVCVISAALAACQLVEAKGDVFLRAIVAGYEISNRIGRGLNPEHYTYWHTTGTVGTLGAAVAAALALDLDAPAADSAIANATSMAAGLQQAFRSDGMTKPLHAGHAAQAGLTAARIAKAGFTGSRDMLSGPAGFIKAMSHGHNIVNEFDDLFDDWTITQSLYKRFSCCGHAFAPIDLAIDLRTEKKIDPRDIRSINLATYDTALKSAAVIHPTSEFEAKFSIPFGVSAALLGHDLTNPSSFASLYDDRDIAGLIDKVRLAADADITRAFPHSRGARMAITMVDGAVHRAGVPTRKGEPSNPLAAADLRKKFIGLIAATRWPDSAAAWLAWVGSLAAGGELAPQALPTAPHENARPRIAESIR
jgi:2-methylcitrate dehydratase PrpD